MSNLDSGKQDRDEVIVSRMNASQRQLRAFIIGLVPSASDADDLLQEVNMALWRKRDQYDLDQDYLPWAYGFAAMEVRGYRRKAAKDQHWFSDSTIDMLATDWPKFSTYMDDCRQALATCLQKLGKPEQQVIVAKYGRQLSIKEIAAETGRPQSTIYKIYARSLKSLKACINQFKIHQS